MIRGTRAKVDFQLKNVYTWYSNTFEFELEEPELKALRLYI